MCIRDRDKTRVVVKVQRPGIRETMAQDITLMRKAVRILKAVSDLGDTLDFSAIIDEMWMVAQQEMNFLQESGHIEEFSRLNRDIEYGSCPKVDLSLIHISIISSITFSAASGQTRVVALLSK